MASDAVSKQPGGPSRQLLLDHLALVWSKTRIASRSSTIIDVRVRPLMPAIDAGLCHCLLRWRMARNTLIVDLLSNICHGIYPGRGGGAVASNGVNDTKLRMREPVIDDIPK